jgi:Fe-S-cluster containining protein
VTGRRRPSTVAAQLDDLYAQLPRINCQGLCWDSCGPIRMTRAEHRRIRAETHVDIPEGRIDAPAMCVALTMLRRCGVYDLRPMICRLWGVVESLPCTFGCRPERYLTDPECYELLAQAYDISGEPAAAARMRAPWSTPEAAARSSAIRRDLERSRIDDHRVRERLAERSGTALYVTGPGRLSRTKPT